MLTHQPTVQVVKSKSKSFPKALLRLSAMAAIAGLTATASMSSHAIGGELLDIELPSMRTPIEAVQTPNAAAVAAAVTGTADPNSEPLTRDRVRESLAMARLANLVTPFGELGDTADVLQAREDFNALQAEVMQAEYRTAALRLQRAQMDDLLAQAEGYAPTAGSADAPQAAPAATEQAVEVVVVSSDKLYELLLEGGHAADTTMGREPAEAQTRGAEQPVVLMLVNESPRN